LPNLPATHPKKGQIKTSPFVSSSVSTSPQPNEFKHDPPKEQSVQAFPAFTQQQFLQVPLFVTLHAQHRSFRTIFDPIQSLFEPIMQAKRVNARTRNNVNDKQKRALGKMFKDPTFERWDSDLSWQQRGAVDPEVEQRRQHSRDFTGL